MQPIGKRAKFESASSSATHKSDAQLSMWLPYWIHFCLAAHTNGQSTRRIVAIRNLCMRGHCEILHMLLIYGWINLATIWFLKHVLGRWICPIPNQMAAAWPYFMQRVDLYSRLYCAIVALSQRSWPEKQPAHCEITFREKPFMKIILFQFCKCIIYHF